MQVTQATSDPMSHKSRRVLHNQVVQHARRPPQRQNVRDAEFAQNVQMQLIWQSEEGI
jgi:hypothetical protein